MNEQINGFDLIHNFVPRQQKTAIIFKDTEHSQVSNLHGKYVALDHISNPFGTLNFQYHFLSHTASQKCNL